MKQLLSPSCVAKFEKALKYELGHFYLYRHLANSVQYKGYFGAQKYFLAESEEEVGHYQKHIDFLNDLGVLPKLQTLVPVSEQPRNLKEAIQMAYDNELDLLEYYREMWKTEGVEYPEIAEHLNFFLATQREAVGFYGDVLATFESEAGNPNINMVIDTQLGK